MEDYEPLNAKVTFDFGSDRKCVSIQLVNDNILEQTEVLEVVLTTSDPYIILNPKVANVSILDTDGQFMCIFSHGLSHAQFP